MIPAAQVVEAQDYLRDMGEWSLAQQITAALNGTMPEPEDDIEAVDWDDPADITGADNSAVSTTDWLLGTFQIDDPIGDLTTSTRRERELGEKTFEASTPGSPASFQAAQAATGISEPSLRWYQQDNGRLDEGRLRYIEGKVHKMRPAAGRDYKAMQKAAKRDGINFSITDSYRTYDQQVELKRRKPDLAATPGHSNHGWGTALDINVNDPAHLAWLRKNGHRFGFHELEGEPWHWDWRPDGSYENPSSPKRKPKKGKKSKPAEQETYSTDRMVGAGFTFANVLYNLESETQPQVKGKRVSRDWNPDDKDGINESVKRLFKRVAAAHGWTGDQWEAFRLIVEGNGDVSGENPWWDPARPNPTSGALGVPQRLPSAHPWETKADMKRWAQNPLAQARWMVSYIEERYGDPTAAWAFKQTNGWY